MYVCTCIECQSRARSSDGCRAVGIAQETGDLIVSDRDNHCIRRIILIKEGNLAVVTTIAGGGHEKSGGVAGYLDAMGVDARFNR